VITPNTPLARSLIGKAAGEQIAPIRTPGTPLVLLLLL
jgi:transcription elongation GreA/GreB family factor